MSILAHSRQLVGLLAAIAILTLEDSHSLLDCPDGYMQASNIWALRNLSCDPNRVLDIDGLG
jgi:hypothetical protein